MTIFPAGGHLFFFRAERRIFMRKHASGNLIKNLARVLLVILVKDEKSFKKTKSFGGIL